MFKGLTETQKNFRKEMAEIQAENQQKGRSGQENPSFYSHYKRDVVSGYYEKPRKAPWVVSGVSLITLAILVWNSYALYTWIAPWYRSTTGQEMPVVSEWIDQKGVQQRAVAKYIKTLKPVQDSMNAYIAAKSQALSGIVSIPVENRAQRIALLQEQQLALEDGEKTLKAIHAPEDLKGHLAIEGKQLQLLLQECQVLVNGLYGDTPDVYNQSIQQANDLLSQFEKLEAEKQSQLIQVMEKNKMPYTLKEGNLQFQYAE